MFLCCCPHPLLPALVSVASLPTPPPPPFPTQPPVYSHVTHLAPGSHTLALKSQAPILNMARTALHVTLPSLSSNSSSPVPTSYTPLMDNSLSPLDPSGPSFCWESLNWPHPPPLVQTHTSFRKEGSRASLARWSLFPVHLHSAALGPVSASQGNGSVKNTSFFPVGRDQAHSCSSLYSELALVADGCSVELLKVVGDRCWPPGEVPPWHPSSLLAQTCASFSLK